MDELPTPSEFLKITWGVARLFPSFRKLRKLDLENKEDITEDDVREVLNICREMEPILDNIQPILDKYDPSGA